MPFPALLRAPGLLLVVLPGTTMAQAPAQTPDPGHGFSSRLALPRAK